MPNPTPDSTPLISPESHAEKPARLLLPTRRKIILGGIAAATGASGIIAATSLFRRYGLMPLTIKAFTTLAKL